ncbi:unnamed protein product, partial [marine sediment metagenome]
IWFSGKILKDGQIRYIMGFQSHLIIIDVLKHKVRRNSKKGNQK